MISVPFRAVLISLIALVAIGGLVATNGERPVGQNSEQAVFEGACTDQGTTLLIDFGPLSGRDPITRCVTGFTGTGWELFGAAGIKVTGTSEYPEAFVCRLEDFPAASIEDCLGTPGVKNGSWAYLYATGKTDAGSWSRSPVGAATRMPGCGESEGWLFVEPGKNQQPNSPSISTKPTVFSCN